MKMWNCTTSTAVTLDALRLPEPASEASFGSHGQRQEARMRPTLPSDSRKTQTRPQSASRKSLRQTAAALLQLPTSEFRKRMLKSDTRDARLT